MSEPQAFVVMGETGEYSDRVEWAVAAYLDHVQAEAHVTRLDEWLREHGVHMASGNHSSYRDRSALKTALDSAFYSDYTGTRYYVMPVTLRACAPTVEVTK